ncbi:hypothetical protein [Microlunatus flavus]|uniref:Uncharacterized protein n=1 Tax=Microlunatus flavus TaxID=1036181 RepID=A0A1H9LCI6_9ACTN|nr:hypothetical protein [Microlunatus flavus]SER08865.1 hypothetical protein SAMN05421756_108248 [Microlunatus flavus]
MTEQTTSPEPDPTPAPAAGDPAGDDHGAALERSAEAIDEAREAEAPVAARDDITTRDSEMAGEYSEDPGGEGGHP